MRVALGSLLLATNAWACPACASGNTGGPRWLHLVMVLLPFVVIAAAGRAIYLALRE